MEKKYKPRHFYGPTHPELFPPELIAYVDPDDWYSYEGIPLNGGGSRNYKDLQELYAHVEAHRKAEGLPHIAHLPEVIGHYLFTLAEDEQKSLFSKQPVTSKYPRTFMGDLQVGVGISVSLSKAAIVGSNIAGGWGWVTKKVANRRAKTCYNCSENTVTKRSLVQRAKDALANLYTANRRTDYDKFLENCGICGCPNRVKVHLSDELIITHSPEDIKSSDFPERFTGIHDGCSHSCWMKEVLDKKQMVGQD